MPYWVERDGVMAVRSFLVGLVAVALGLLSSPLAPWRHARIGKAPSVSSGGGGGTGFGRVPFGTAAFGDGTTGGGGGSVLPLVVFRSGSHRPVRAAIRRRL